MSHPRLNLPILRFNDDGTVNPDSLRMWIRVLNDWSRNLDAFVSTLETENASLQSQVDEFQAGVGWGGIGTT